MQVAFFNSRSLTAIGFLIAMSGARVAPPPSAQLAPDLMTEANLARYENQRYGFIISYPKQFMLDETNPGATSTMVRLVALAAEEQGVGRSQFDEELRVNVQTDHKSVLLCLGSGQDGEGQTLHINAVSFEKFRFTTIGESRFTQVHRYNTVHDNRCYTIVVERSASLDAHADELDPRGVYLKTLDKVVDTFEFVP